MANSKAKQIKSKPSVSRLDESEEYIVGRLMEKLQMASHAIGDIDALLEASGIGDEGESFEEKILQLVLAALEGRDVEAATHMIEQSITDAKNELEREEERINAMLGGMDGVEYVGPQAPNLPGVVRSMGPSEFTLAAFKILGARVTQRSTEHYLVEENGRRELIRVAENAGPGHPLDRRNPGERARQ